MFIIIFIKLENCRRNLFVFHSCKNIIICDGNVSRSCLDESILLFLADRFNKASCLFCRNSIKCETSSVKRDFPLSEVLLPITIMDLIGNLKFKYSHASHLAPYMVVT